MRYSCKECRAECSSESLGEKEECPSCGFVQTVPETVLSSGAYLRDLIIEKYLGSGRSGDVFRAYDPTLERLVAVKVLSRRYDGDSDIIFNFVDEAKKSANLQHPNIVQVYGCDEYEGYYFFVMELVKGQSLRQYIDEKSTFLTAEFTVNLIYQVVNALDYIWSETSSVHGTLQLDNILLTEKGIVKLCEVGSVAYDEGTGKGLIFSPEVLQDKKPDFRSDIYCAGILFYAILNGEVPYAELAENEYRKQVCQGDLPDLLEDSELGASFNDLVSRMTSNSRSGRYQSYESLLDDLTFLRKEFKSGAKVELLDKVRQKSISNQSHKGLIAFGLFVLFALGVLISLKEEPVVVEERTRLDIEHEAWQEQLKVLKIKILAFNKESDREIQHILEDAKKSYSEAEVLEDVDFWSERLEELRLRRARETRWKAYLKEVDFFRETIVEEIKEKKEVLKLEADRLKQASQEKITKREQEVARHRFLDKAFTVLRGQVWRKLLIEGDFSKSINELKKFSKITNEEYATWAKSMLLIVEDLQAANSLRETSEVGGADFSAKALLFFIQSAQENQEPKESSLRVLIAALLLNENFNAAHSLIESLPTELKSFYRKEMNYLKKREKIQ